MKMSEASPIATRMGGAASLNPIAHLGDGERLGAVVEELLTRFLAAPAGELMRRPSHNFRSRLVTLGFSLICGENPSEAAADDLELCARSIELLHLGSLIVDDVQDGSSVRRGGQALHALVGIPQAIAVGNWLYFHASNQLRDVKSLDARQRLALTETFQHAVEMAHLGQALDLGVKMESLNGSGCHEVATMCARLKTGSLVMLALTMGGIIARAGRGADTALKETGLGLGVFLQRLNDLGNFFGSFDEDKQFEDVSTSKPSFVWSFTVLLYGQEAASILKQAIQVLPDRGALSRWSERFPIRDEAWAFAEADYSRVLQQCDAARHLTSTGMAQLARIKEQIVHAYL